MFEDKKVLLLAAHPDDIVFCMGATLYKILPIIDDIKVVVFSDCKESVPKWLGFSEDAIANECADVYIEVYTIYEKLSVLRFPVRNFDKHRQEILDVMIGIKEQFGPDIVFSNSANDVHQDHIVIGSETVRAFNNSTLIAFSTFVDKGNMLVQVSEEDVERKLEAISLYKTQQHRVYMNRDAVLGRLRWCAAKNKLPGYAEMFEVVKVVI